MNSGATASFSTGSVSGFVAGLQLVESAAARHPGFLQIDNNAQNRDRSAIVEGIANKAPRWLGRAQLRGGGGEEACGGREQQGWEQAPEPSRAEPKRAAQAGAASSNHVGVWEAVRGWRG